MYLKLMTRGLLRYRKRGRRFFVLLSLCSCALIFLFTFKSDFKQRNKDQFIGLEVGHLQIVPEDSPKVKQSFTFTERETVPLVSFDNEFNTWINALPEVEIAIPVIQRYGISYNLNSEQEAWLAILAVPAALKDVAFPVAKVLEGSADLSWNLNMENVPLQRPRLQTEFGEQNWDATAFYPSELKAISPETMLEFINRLAKDFPQYFSKDNYEEEAALIFFDEWALSLKDPHLKNEIPEKFFDDYNWRLDDALYQIDINTDPQRESFLNKQIFQALYPNDINIIHEPVAIGNILSLQLPKFTVDTAISMPTIIPIEYTGFCEISPLFMSYAFMDIDAFRHFMELGEYDATHWLIRLHSEKDLKKVQALVEQKLNDMGVRAKVLDYQWLGQMYLATGTAFGMIIDVMVIIFIVLVLIFTLNLVLMAIIQRRREIGTGLALGLSNAQTIVIMCGEIAVIAFVSCCIGSILGFVFVFLARLYGIPGMIFFSQGKLFLTMQWQAFVFTFALIVPSSIGIALFALFKLRNNMPIELLREAH